MDRNKLVLAGYVVLFVAATVVVFDVLFVVFGGLLALFVLARGRQWMALETALSQNPLTVIGVPSAVFAAIALIWALTTLARSEKWLLKRLRAELVPKGELIPTKMALKDVSIAAGFTLAPALYMVDASSVNAFVFAARRRRAVIGITRGFAERLSADEQRAVFANLVARLASGDTIVSTGVTALLWPLHAWRDRVIRGQNDHMDREMAGQVVEAYEVGLLVWVFGFALAFVGEVFAAGHRHKQLRTAEKADAEGMLLLKDPPAMLSALEKCVRYDNVVVAAGETFGDLFYCWTGDSTNDEDDPEWKRVARLREVLGVEAWIPPTSV